VLLRPCGLTSVQLARVAELIPFNDTRAAALTVASPLLLDDEHLAEVFTTLVYDWELTEKTIYELLCKKEAPETFRMPAAAAV